MPIPTPAQLTQCIQLVRDVSWRANQNDMTMRQRRTAEQNIRNREAEVTGNQGLIWWKTWFREQNGAVDAVAFFQKMKHKGEAYAMCVGFAQNLLPDPTDLALEYQYSEFLEKISDKGNATGLHEFVKSDLKADFVYIVDLPPESAHRDKTHDAKRDKLFEIAKRYYRSHDDWDLSTESALRHHHWCHPEDDPATGTIYRLRPNG